jgi:hypothetical protein
VKLTKIHPGYYQTYDGRIEVRDTCPTYGGALDTRWLTQFPDRWVVTQPGAEPIRFDTLRQARAYVAKLR